MAADWHPLSASQTSVVQGSPSSHAIADSATQRPASSHVSLSVQTLPSVHAVPAAATTQVEEQQSPSTRLPSSHDSAPS